MNVLKLRWPAFLGTNIIWSLALFVIAVAPLAVVTAHSG